MEKNKKFTSFFSNNVKANDNAISTLIKKLDLLEKRVIILETQLKRVGK